MNIPLRILIVEEAELDSMLQLKALHSNGYQQMYKRVDRTEDLITALTEGPWDIVIVDISRLQFDEESILRMVMESGVILPCLILSERTNGERHVKTFKYGVEEDIQQNVLNHFIPSIRGEMHGSLLNGLNKSADKEVRDQKEWFRVTLASIGDAVITTDTSSNVTFMNPVAEQITGYSQEEAIGKPISHVFRIFNEITLEQAEIPVDRVIRDGFIIGLANHTGLVTKNGETRSIADSAAPIRSDDDTIIGVVMVFRDITETKQMEEQMARLDKLNVVGQMAAGIAHEIRNPMTTVNGFLQLLKINGEFKQYTDYFDVMLNEMDRANSIISGFLSLAKDKVVEVREENLNRIIQSVAPLIQAEAIMDNKYVQLHLADIPNLVLIENDVRQLILNLVRNALEASDPGKGITLHTFAEDGNVVFAVEDQGVGIEPHILEKLGTPFLTTKENGTGLGLVVCYNVAEKHGASMKVQSDSSGTTFSVLFKETPEQPLLFK
ncbi:MAG TPA: ATP-binding protein [Syntrophomonadaceae bacterium]|nr:ATP-binding protein [Syntrophomonadaceae bacterium]